MAGPWRYPAELAAALAGHGLVPTSRTPPALAREAVDDLYKYELRRLRDRLRRGDVDRASYLARVVALRKKYWVLTLPLSAWIRICSTTSSP
jgi:hypothetical protein